MDVAANPTSILFQYGLAGVVILGMAAVIYRLYLDSQKKDDKIEALMEARRQDAQETKEKVIDGINGLAKMSQLLYDKIELTKQRGRK